MKVNNLFLVGVAALSLGMTACNNEDVPQVNNPGRGNNICRNVYFRYEGCFNQSGE